MPDQRHPAVQGFIDTIPLGIGVTIYGIVYGIMGHQNAIPLWVILGLSLIVFAGSSQMIAVGMMASGADPVSTTITVLVVNLRHIVMGADISRYVSGSSIKARIFSAFFLTDEAYAVSYAKFRREPAGSAWYVMGCGLNIYVFWGASGVIGYLGGDLLPAIVQPALGFAMAAAFLAMLVPLIRDMPTLAAVIAAAAVAVAGNLYLPGKWYILLAALAGSMVGFLLGERRRAADAPQSVQNGGGAV